MNRGALFTLALLVGIILVVITILTWSGVLLGHKPDGPGGLNYFKHGLLFILLAIVAFVFAAATRPTARV